MSEFEFAFPNLSIILVPFVLLVIAIILMIGIIVFLAKKELKNEGE